MKLFHKDEYGGFYIVETEEAYLQWLCDWPAVIRRGVGYNWVNFTFWNFDIDWQTVFYRHLTINFILLGFGLRFYFGAATAEQKEEIECISADWEESRIDELTWRAEALGRRPMPSIVVDDLTTDGNPIYFARCSVLDGCVAQGNTVNEAFDNLVDARIDYILSMLEKGLELPVDTRKYGEGENNG